MGDIKIIGLDELEKKLKRNCTLQDVKTVVKKRGADLQKGSMRAAPVGTPESTGIPGYVGGTLKRSIGIEISDGGMTAAVEPSAEYAPYVEYGTRFMSAQPYLRPTLSKVGNKFKADVRKLVK